MIIAAIDIGSNAVRLQIARTSKKNGEDKIKKLEFVRIPVRLGDDAFKHKKIGKEKRKIFYKAMLAFANLMDAYQVEYYLAFATSAMREAINGQKIVDKVKEKYNLKISIIDGKKESEIILKSIEKHFKPDTNYLTIDVGGGSTEMTIIKNKEIVNSISFDIGTVRMVDGEVKEKTWQTMEDWVKHKTNNIDNLVAVVTSGTINKISNIINNGGVDGYFTKTQLRTFHRKVVKMSLKERMEQLKLNPDRADIIELSADIYLRILSWAKIGQVFSPSNSGLKDGILTYLYHTYEV